MKKRILSIIMVLSMCLSMLPTAVFAAEVDTGLCEHHPEHTEECGYKEAVAGMDCTHEHTAECYTNGVLPEGDADSSAYYVAEDTETLLSCTHTHDGDCYVTACVHTHDGDCGYTEAVPCGHAHDETCGYAPAVEEVTCACTETGEDGQIVHTEGCGYAAPVEGTPCGHTEHTDCGYVEAAPCAHVCGEDTGCVTLSCPHVHDEACSSAGELSCQHVHDDACGYVEAVEASPCTYECALCGLTEITAWSWIDEWEMLDPDTGVLALPGASADNPALFDVIVSLLPVEITAMVEGGEEIVALDGWACPGYPEEGAYSGNYIFTAALPEGYILAEDAPALTVTVDLGGAALFAGGTYNVSSGPLTINNSNLSTYNGATITGSLTLDTAGNMADILVIDGVTVALTIENLNLTTNLATTNGYSPIDLKNGATLNLTVSGTNTLTAEYHAAGIHVPAGCTLNITAASTGTLTVNGGGGYGGGAGIGADGNGYFDGYDSTTQTCGTINIAGGTIIATGGGHYVMGTYALGGAGIGGSTTGTSGGVASTGSITISGGNVTATGGGQAAGIGGGGSGYVQSISISGGTVTAKAEYGAAIGSGSDSNATPTFTNCPTAISITGGTVTADGNIGYGGSLYGTISGGSLSIDPGASVALTDGHKIDHDNASNYAIIPVTLNVYDGRLTDTTEWVTMNAAQGGSRIGGAGVELAVSNYHGTAKLNFVVPVGNATGATDFTVAGNGFTATSESSATLTTSGIIVNCGKQLYPVTLTFLDDEKFTSEANDYTATLTVTTEGGTPAEGTIMATLPSTIEYHSASMGTMVVWLAADTYNISVTASDLNDGSAMTGNITVSGSTTLNLLDNSSAEVLGNLDLSHGPIKFYKDGETYKVDYYAASGANAATTATVLVSAPFVVTQSGETTTNTITVTDWGTDVPLDLTIDGLNIETNTALSNENNAGHIDINGSSVNLNLSGSSSLKSTYGTYADVTAALVSVDGTSSLTIDGTGSLTVNTNAYGAAIGGDQSSTVGTITIKGGTVTSTNTGIGAAIGTGYAGTSGGHAVITIEGGTVTANGDGGSRTAIGAAVSQGNNVNTASVTIKGGEVNATGIIGASQSSATVEISGGTVNATANTSGATIGGDVYYKTVGENMSVTISGGTVTATNTGKGPAIGGSGVSDKYAAATNKTAGKVTISGGTVTATNSSNTAAAIGASGGYYFDRTDVTISGGRVTATNNATNGVAIGGGYITGTSYTDPYTYSDVTITGGTVAATGVIGSAAKVAGPESTQYATVTITGGSVNGEVWAYSDTTTNVGATSDGTTSVYKITADLSSTVGTDAKVTSASITGNTSYGFDDVYTDADGKIYLWLPGDGTSETKAAFNGGNYTGTVKTDNTGVFTADKLTPTVTAPTANTLTYNGEAQALVAAGSTTGGTLQYALGTDGTNAPADGWGTTIPTGTDAKTYYVWYKVEGNDEYADVAAMCVTVTIDKRAITVKADDQTVLQNNQPDNSKISVTSGSLVDGHILTATLKTVTDVATLGTQTDALEIDTITIMSGGTNVSSNYNVTTVKGTLTVATHTHSWSYEQATTNTTNDTIKATCSSDFGDCPVTDKTVTITLTAPTGDALIYNSSPIGATATSSNSTELAAPTTITYTGRNSTNYNSTTAPTNAGDYTASITLDGKTASVEYTIAAKSITDATITLSATSGNYTGSAHTLTVTVTGLTQGTDFTVTFPTDMTNGGEKSITVRGMGNYTGTQTLTYTVNPIAPIVANFDFSAPSNLTYSGTAKAAAVAPATGITGMGAVTVKYSADPINVGEYTVSIDVAAGTNYTAATDLTDSAWKFSITKAPLTITADNKSMLTGKTLPELTCSYSGFVNGETASVLTTQPSVTTTANGQTAGTFDITVSGAAATNYEISYVKGTLTVSDHVHAWTYTADDTANTITAQCGAEGCPTPTQVITLAAPTGDLTYTGSAKEATVSGSIDGVATPTISYTGSLTEGKPVNAGSYTASITVESKSVSVDIVIGNASQTAPSVSAKNETIKGAADGGITGATADMEYSATSGGTYATIPEKLAAGTYYVRYKAKTNYDPSPDTTVTIAAGPAIAVTFNVDGGTPAPNAQSLSYKEKVTKPTDPTKTDYEFLGWYNGDTAYDFNTEVTDASLTLTAKWKQVAFTVGVDIKDGENGMEGISVKLMKGSEVLHSGTTNSSGHIDFSHITAGAYNIVAVFDSGDAEQTRTALVTLTGDKTETINKPLEGANSHLAVTDDADTPAVVVGGLDTEAEALKNADNTISEISVSMDVDGKKEAEVETTVVNAIKEQIQSDNTLKGANPVVEYLDATMVKEVKTTSGSTSTAGITETQTLMELVVPFPGGRKNPVVIRHHRDEQGNETAEKMTQNPSDGQEGFKVDEASETLHIYTKKFSTYAIAYTTEYTITFDANEGVLSGSNTATTASNGTVTLPTTNPTRSGYTFKGWYTAASGGTQVTASTVFKNDTTIYAQWTQNQITPPSSGGGGGVSTYAITVEDADHGTVKSDRTRASYGSTVTITVTPDEGYKLGSLTVKDASGRKIEVTGKGDGKYTFKMPGGKVTVEASFVSDTAGAPCDGGADCPSAKFIDIDPNAWYHDALDYVIEHGLMGGYGNGYFGTNDDLSRGMLARILYNLEGRPAVSGDMPFTDVAADRYYFDAILWAHRNGIAGGYGGGLFGPDDPITREQLAVMLWRYAGSPAATKKELDFTDADEAGDWAVDALIWAQENGIMQGDNGAVNPKGNASRSHVAQMLKNFIENIIK